MIINISAKNRLFQYCYGTVIVQSLSRVQLLATPWTIAHQVSLSFTISRSCSNSCPLSQWCYLTISSSVAPFSSCPRSFPASGSFPVSRLLASGGQSMGASVLPVNTQGWFPLGLTGLSSLLSKGLSGVFSSITVWKHQFFSTQPSLWSNSHIHTWLLENHSFDYMNLCQQSDVSAF